jgi:sensor histidine kinase regulating citrate/malate metabolism
MESVSLAAEADSHGGDSSIIAKLEASSIDRVVAGQAVTDLASAVKELVDNALDANSKTIKSKTIAFAHLSYRCGR